MNFHISVNLIFVSAPALYYQSYFSGLGLGNHLHIKVEGVSSHHIAMTVIQNQTCKKRKKEIQLWNIRNIFSFLFHFFLKKF